jgi:hypothetical protein
MKISLNKQVMSDLKSMSEDVASEVSVWKERHHKRHIRVERRAKVSFQEDMRYTAHNIMTGASVAARAAGEFAGMTDLRPGASMDLPENVVVVEEGFFCGVPVLTIFIGNGEFTGLPMLVPSNL